MLEAGLAAFEAVPRAAATVGNPALRRELEQVETALNGGSSLGDALGESPRLRALSGYALIGSGEEAGRVSEMLLRWAAQLDNQAGEQRDLWSAWLPRRLYLGVAAWMAYGLLGGSATLVHS